jgi:hypothetical protein
MGNMLTKRNLQKENNLLMPKFTFKAFLIMLFFGVDFCTFGKNWKFSIIISIKNHQNLKEVLEKYF